MPELPEVETIKRGLEKSVLGQRVLNIEIRNEKIISSHSNIRKPNKVKTESFIKSLTGKKIIAVKRRAKNIIIEIEDGGIILVHLKMTGQLIYNPHPNPPSRGGSHSEIQMHLHFSPPLEGGAGGGGCGKHTHLIFTLEKGDLLYNDIRQFGYVLYYKNIEEAIQNKHFEKLGLEPLSNSLNLSIDEVQNLESFTPVYLKEKLNKINKNIKSTLLAQNIVVGIGNIYADEICFASNISPHRICKTLNDIEINLLYKNIKNILSKAIERGGSSVSDYKLVNGESGRYHLEHKVYGRAGKECYNCKTILTKDIIMGRSSVWCEVCQK